MHWVHMVASLFLLVKHVSGTMKTVTSTKIRLRHLVKEGKY